MLYFSKTRKPTSKKIGGSRMRGQRQAGKDGGTGYGKKWMNSFKGQIQTTRLLLLSVLWRESHSPADRRLINSGSPSLENHPLPILRRSYFKLPRHSSFFPTSSLISAEPTCIFRENSSNVSIPSTSWALSRCPQRHPHISGISVDEAPYCPPQVHLSTLL